GSPTADSFVTVGSVYSLNGPSQTVGSAGSPVQFYSGPLQTFLSTDVNGVSTDPNSFLMFGLAGSTVSDMTQIKGFPTAANYWVFSGYSVGTALHAVSAVTTIGNVQCPTACVSAEVY